MFTYKEYDSDSRKIRTIYPDGSVECFQYDGNGNLVKKVRAETYNREFDDGSGIIYEYDNMNHLFRIVGEDGGIRSTFCYDPSGNLVEQTDGAGYTTLHAYDYVGNRTATWKPLEETLEGIWYSITLYEYDAESNKISEKRGLDKVKAGGYAERYHELARVSGSVRMWNGSSVIPMMPPAI